MRMSSGLQAGGGAQRASGRIPGPGTFASVVRAASLVRGPLEELTYARKTYGDLARYAIGPVRFVIVNDPDVAHHVLVTNAKNYHKSPTYRGLKLLLGNGLVTSEGDFWKRQRKLAQPAFHHRCIVEFVAAMVRCCDDLIDKWNQLEDGARIDVQTEMLELTLRTVGHTLFSTELGPQAPAIHDALTVSLDHANAQVETPIMIPPWIPTPANLRFRKAKATLDDVVMGIISERRRSGAEHTDLLGLLMAATDEGGTERMTDEQLRDEAMTLLLAGHETVANNLSWTFHLLAQHPEIADELAAEAHAVMADGPPTFDAIKKLELTDRVVNESMRLYPPAWIFERQAQQADELAGHPIEAKTMIAIPPWTLHRHEGLWESPQTFDPGRFLPERSKDRHRFAFLPFGGGPRRCIGNMMAMVEAKVMLAKLVSCFRLEAVPGHRVVPDPGVTLRPGGGLPMTLRRRTATGAGHAAA